MLALVEELLTMPRQVCAEPPVPAVAALSELAVEPSARNPILLLLIVLLPPVVRIPAIFVEPVAVLPVAVMPPITLLLIVKLPVETLLIPKTVPPAFVTV